MSNLINSTQEKKEKGVIHFLEITKTTFNTYISEEILENGVHYVMNKTKRFLYLKQLKILKKVVKWEEREMIRK